MPVVTVYFERLLSMLNGNISREELIDKIPYLSLDIEEINYISIEHIPGNEEEDESLNGIEWYKKWRRDNL